MDKQQYAPIRSTIGETEYHNCRRCKRLMPSDQFRGFHGNLGDVYRGKLLLHPFCHTCRKQRLGKHATHKLYSPKLDRFMTKLASRAKSSYTRGLNCYLDKDDLIGLYIEQNGLCALSGFKLTFGMGNVPTHVSVDRIDSGKDYTLDNVQLVCRVVNIMKNDQDQRQFVKWCKRVTLAALRKQKELQDGISAAELS
jgi:hypothetical protein